ncbi:MAG TPA: addiction module protein [Pirellulales bacterium]|jgi:putative addiction module component (TIGR02574 family)|nr:addiction module protein [Pirellulales bacterium]
MNDYDSILAAASSMPIADQLRLIDELAASVPDDQPPTLSKQWLAEIERRSAEIDSGTVTTQPWPEVRQQLFSQVGLKRAD